MSNNKLKIIDLCGRLPYGVLCLVPDYMDTPIRVTDGDITPLMYDDWLSYLRPMDSMTADEAAAYSELQSMLIECLDADIDYNPYSDVISQHIDWLNAHHLDYRGLIQQGLALEASEDMYKKRGGER